MGIRGTKTKPAVTLTFDVTEIHIVPGTNEVTVVAISDDREVKRIHRTVNIQDKVDALTDTRLAQVNELFRRLVAAVADISEENITGDIFTKST